MNKYEIDFTFFISLGSNKREYKESIVEKDSLLDLLDDMSEIENYDVYNDGEDWCIDCIATIKAKTIDQVDGKMFNLFNDVDCTWDYHYIKGLNTKEFWQP